MFFRNFGVRDLDAQDFDFLDFWESWQGLLDRPGPGHVPRLCAATGGNICSFQRKGSLRAEITLPRAESGKNLSIALLKPDQVGTAPLKDRESIT